MQAIIIIFLLALTVTTVSTPWAQKAALALGFVDAPQKRKLHSTPMPLLGGVAIFAGAIVGILALVGSLSQPVIGGLLAAGTVALVGLIDDRWPLPPFAKFGGQVLGFVILVYFGVQVQLPVPNWLNIVITFVWVIGISNAINFLDNMDGLSAGVSGVAAAFMLLLATIHDQYLVAALSAALLGATLGFLRYNFKPAQIFMGDTGSLFLGCLLAILGLQLRFPNNVNFVTWMVPVLILGLPIFDMTLVVISRLRRGVSPMTAGKDHTSHRLVARGFSQREAVLMLYLASGLFGMIAVFVTQATVLEVYVLGAGSAVCASYAIYRLEEA